VEKSAHRRTSFNLQISNKIVIVLLLIFSVYELAAAFSFKVDPASIPVWDTAGYVTALVQYEHPTALSQDTIYGNHKFSDSIWASSTLYMIGLKLLHQLTNQDIALTYSLYRALLLILYISLMYVLLQRILKNNPVSLALSIISSYSVAFLATESQWGIPFDLGKLVPETLYVPFSILLAFLAFHYWFKPPIENRPVKAWHVVGIGIITGASTYLVHAISSIAAFELLFLFTLVQSWRRKLPLWSFILFTVTASPWLITRLFVGSGVSGEVSQADASVVLNIGQGTMIFPWHERWTLTTLDLPVNTLTKVLTDFFVLYLFMTLVCWLTLAFSKRFRQPAKYLFVTIEAIYTLCWMQAGWIPLLILVYGYYRIRTRSEDELDHSLFLALVIANLLGPAQQTALYWLYLTVRPTGLVGLLFEVARFQFLSYVPFFILTGRAVLLFTASQDRAAVRRVPAVILLMIIVLNLHEFAYPLGSFKSEQLFLLCFLFWWAIKLLRTKRADLDLQKGSKVYSLSSSTISPTRSVQPLIAQFTKIYIAARKRLVSRKVATRQPRMLIVSWGGICAGGWIVNSAYIQQTAIPDWLLWLALFGIGLALIRLQWQVRWGHVIGSALRISIFCLFIFFGLQRIISFDTFMQQLSNQPAYVQPHRDYLELAAWAKANTQPDSLFLLTDLNPSFRYFAQRSLVLAYTDVTLGVYTDVSSSTLARLYSDIQTYAKQPTYLACFAGTHRADYIVANIEPPLSACNSGGTRYNPHLVYKNSSYALYKLDRS
jgi:hypothetical protein